MFKSIIAFIQVLFHPSKATQAVALIREGCDVIETAQDTLTDLTKDTALSRPVREHRLVLAKDIAEFIKAMRQIRE